MSAEIIRDPSQLLPHRAPMLLLDEVVDYGAEHASTRIVITTASPLYDVELGGVPAWVGIEYMAQTIGVWAGAQRLAHGKAVTIGFLLSARRYESSDALFPLGSELNVRVDMLYSEEGGLGSFNCQLDGRTSSGTLTAKARINAFQPEQPHQFVKETDALLAAAFPDADKSADDIHNNIHNNSN